MNYEPGTIGNDGRLAFAGARSDAGRGRLWIIVLVAVLSVIALVYFLSAGGEDKKSAAATGAASRGAQVPKVTVEIPGRQEVGRTVSATGSIAAKVDMPVGVAGEGGLVTNVLVQPGQWVRAGQVLATVDRSVQLQTGASLAAQVNVARSDARIAQAELDRAAALIARGFISKADLDRRTATRDAANARVNVAQAQLAEANARTGRLNIRAPAAGLVLTRNVEPGQVVSAGSGTLFRLAKGGELELRAALSDADMTAVSVGVSAQVTPVGSERTFAGRIWQVSPVIDPQTRQGIARIALGYDPALRPGGFAAAVIASGTSQVPLLPQSAVQSDAKGNFVYILNNKDEVVRQPIKVGQVSDAGVAISEGLVGNERVVVSAGAFLNPGQKVAPVLQKKQG
ncbi:MULTISPECIES: efflux RND transporter periplasmic adaptor subunit [unclassified Sphingomonas]|uniref:efflux RND transporter periplasmic adaptor subunit n=1 Tax=unclassified Sphingomonas TaxID=196159 RepID=UPI000BD59153|nr:MAG: efflux transporter periplasmic adaptor subunit [Sphingomonas sp. 12-62-6]OYX37896.1 MAG: efflux transporter periplasmic adaptor subunit [Sphingomonas sp. 32-62-10]OYY65145.1 MAG: efflux transporter periplasmic adaptor subunit [Sphingomonas sp. 28-62-11]